MVRRPRILIWFLTNLRALGAQFALGFRIAMFVTALALGIVGMLQPVGSATVPGYWMSLALIAGGLVALSVAAGL